MCVCVCVEIAVGLEQLEVEWHMCLSAGLHLSVFSIER